LKAKGFGEFSAWAVARIALEDPIPDDLGLPRLTGGDLGGWVALAR
jgi:hypothetical protein